MIGEEDTHSKNKMEKHCEEEEYNVYANVYYKKSENLMF